MKAGFSKSAFSFLKRKQNSKNLFTFAFYNPYKPYRTYRPHKPLIHQADYLLRKYIEKLQYEFLWDGGIKEQMYKARVNSRNNPQ